MKTSRSIYLDKIVLVLSRQTFRALWLDTNTNLFIYVFVLYMHSNLHVFQTLIAGGADTTTVMLTWTLALLLNNGYALKRVQEELDVQVGKDRQVNESDIKNLVYLQAVVKETLRLYPSTCLNPPRAFSNDCTIAGYHVPKGTWLLINTWKLHRDPKIWSDPCEFRPERFLSPNHKDLGVKGTDFELIPFGAGRRHCPGVYLASQMLHMILATFIQNFEMSTLNGAPIDMSMTSGLTNAMASPLEVLLSPRLHATTYV